MDEVNRRLDLAEENIRELFREVKAVEVTQGKMGVTLDNLNLTLRELTQAVSGLQARPAGWWDRIIQALITAAVAAAVAYFVGGA